MVLLEKEIAIVSTVYALLLKQLESNCDGKYSKNFVFTMEDINNHMENVEKESGYAILEHFSESTIDRCLNAHSELFELTLVQGDGSIFLEYKLKLDSLGHLPDPTRSHLQYASAVGAKLMEILDPPTNYPGPVFCALGLVEILSDGKVRREDMKRRSRNKIRGVCLKET